MKIRKVTIRNFRNLKNIIVYPQKTTLIVGENNAGKSNFLHAIRLILDPLAERLRSELSEADINETAITEGEEYFSIILEIGDLQNHLEVEGIFRERLDLDETLSETFVTIEGSYRKNSDGDFEFETNVLSP
jgi:predicted ATP-dependent endonuclease of OLD family